MLKIVEPYIHNRMNGMSAENILDAIKGYYQVGDPRQETLVALEQMLMDHLHQINIEFVGEILYFYTKNKVGQRIMVSKLLDRVRSDVNSGIIENLNVHLRIQFIATLYDCGAHENDAQIKK